MSIPQPEPCHFQALIVPHRSLSPRGLRILCCTLGGLTVLIGLRCWLFGAWPVMAISVPEVALAVFLLRLNMRRARASELLVVTADQLSITRTSPSGATRKVALPLAWLNVVLEEAPGRVPRLLLRNRSAVEEVARELGEEPKRELAHSLRQALHDARNPRFDNPQLRENTAPVC
jgi:uncharacterized membrane protein